MALRLYDTMTRQKRDFTPIDPSNVRMYVCGPTVYDFAHIGNARPVIVFDVLFRLMRHLYGADHVTYVRNITDVDDKINDRAARDYPGLPLNEAIRKVTEKTADQFQADVAALGCLAPTHQPRATENIDEMIDIIGVLLSNGCAYIARGPEGREVLFAVEKMKNYGRLSHRKLEDQRDGARVAVEAHKRNPADFVLWKESSPSEPGWLARFPSGYPANDQVEIHGRPGWHIECSAMAWRYLGRQFDIHGGGLDLIFPHHENEIAQSCCAFNTDRMANTWMHNGFLQVEGEKMSKSLGNFFTIRELLETQKFGGDSWAGEILRLAMLKTHYRSPIDWTVKALDETHKVLWDWYQESEGALPTASVPDEVIEGLADDLNVSNVIAAMHTMRKEKRFNELASSMKFLGFSNREAVLSRRPVGARINLPPISVRAAAGSVTVLATPLGKAEIEMHIAARAAARDRKDFAESDRIRDELAAMGVVLKDGKDAEGKPVTTWEIAR